VILHVDTSFFVDLLREGARETEGPASVFLAAHLEDELRSSLFVACELLLGAERSDRSAMERRRVEEILTVVPMELPTTALAPVYARVLADLQGRGEAIATMDLLIGASAIVAGVPLVTRNAAHFARLRDLQILEY
jgi:tRNA(fMet)-specific endonuclease VapC